MHLSSIVWVAGHYTVVMAWPPPSLRPLASDTMQESDQLSGRKGPLALHEPGVSVDIYCSQVLKLSAHGHHCYFKDLKA